VSILQSAIQSVRSDFARVISEKFERGRFLIICARPEELERQFRETEREAVVSDCCANLVTRLRQDGVVTSFEIAVWSYSSEKNDDNCIVEELSRRANDIVLIPGVGADVARRRPQLVESFRRFGLLPDYRCDLVELHSAAVCLRRELSETAEALGPAAETAFARLYTRLVGLERILRTRLLELEAADRHIATLEEKLLKLKQYRRDLKLLKEQRKTLRKSPERRVGQALLAPYRIPEKLVKAAWKKLHRGNARRERPAVRSAYQAWLERHRASAAGLDRMRHEAHAFPAQPLVSVMTPVFDTPVHWLEEAVASVLGQAYENWQLLLIDDGSSDSNLLKALPALAARDRRIILARVGEHEGISAALNRGLALAHGEWVTFLDHDDVLEPDALFQMVKLLQVHSDADLIYSDEDKLTEDGCDAPVFKPDWSPDFFLSYNYVGHLTAIRREILQKVGGFRSEFDSAQDYDLFFRVIEQTNRIHHIPRVLYHWRRSANSSAISVRQKPKQFNASRLAIEDHLKRRGESAHVAVDWRTHAFCTRRELSEARKISIIIPSRDDVERLARSIEGLTSKTSYPDYEIVVVGNDSQSLSRALVFRAYRIVCCASQARQTSPRSTISRSEQTESPWLLFLNGDVEVIENDWLTIMAEHIQRPRLARSVHGY
jgi:glycosyltransferase involved in cell wall biosynthesis